MDIREGDRQSQSFSQATIANPAPATAKPANRFYRPAFLVGVVLLAARLLLLAFNLYAAFHPGSSRQTLADGKVFEYRYKGTASSEPVSAASVTRPDGTVLIFAMSEDGTTVRERVRP